MVTSVTPLPGAMDVAKAKADRPDKPKGSRHG